MELSVAKELDRVGILFHFGGKPGKFTYDLESLLVIFVGCFLCVHIF